MVAEGTIEDGGMGEMEIVYYSMSITYKGSTRKSFKTSLQFKNKLRDTKKILPRNRQANLSFSGVINGAYLLWR